MLTERELLKYIPFSPAFYPSHSTLHNSLTSILFFKLNTVTSVQLWTKVIFWTWDLGFPKCLWSVVDSYQCFGQSV